MVVCVWAGLVVGLRAVSLLLGEEFSPVTVDVVGVMRQFTGADPQLYSGTYTSQYCLSTWIRFESSLPASTVKPISMLTAGKVNLGMEIDSTGSIVAYSDLVEGTSASATRVTGLSANIWLLIAVCACNSLLSISTAPYQGTASTSSQAISGTFLEYDPVHSTIVAYGDGVTALGTAEMLAVRVTLDTCLTVGILTSQAAACSPYCATCINPAFPSCAEFVQLVDPFNPMAFTHATPLSISAGDPIFNGRDYSSLDLAVTGWYKNTFPGDLNLFKVENNACVESVLPTEECRVMTEYVISSALSGWVDTANTANVPLATLALPADFGSGKWYFFATSNCVGNSAIHCFAAFASTPICVSTPLASAPFPFLRTSSQASIHIGHSSFGGVEGAVLDVRYHPSLCLSSGEVQSMVTRKANECVPGCSSCDNPENCIVCTSGFYLSLGKCVPCNSCCQSCTAAGSTNCSSCAGTCTLISANTCLRKYSI